VENKKNINKASGFEKCSKISKHFKSKFAEPLVEKLLLDILFSFAQRLE